MPQKRFDEAWHKVGVFGHKCLALAYIGRPSFQEHIAARRDRWDRVGRPAHLQATAGKLAGRQFVLDHGYRVPERIAVLDHISGLDALQVYGPRFVVKPIDGYSAKNVFAMHDGINLFDGLALSRADIIAAVGPETTSRFIVEELIQDFTGRRAAPLDYKFYCFGNDVPLVQVVERNSTSDLHQNRIWYLTEAFERIGMTVRLHIRDARGKPPLPPHYPAMLAMARDLSCRLNGFVRVDMYDTPTGPVFGEFTPFPGAGRGYAPRANAMLGRHWKGIEGC